MIEFLLTSAIKEIPRACELARQASLRFTPLQSVSMEQYSLKAAVRFSSGFKQVTTSQNSEESTTPSLFQSRGAKFSMVANLTAVEYSGHSWSRSPSTSSYPQVPSSGTSMTGSEESLQYSRAEMKPSPLVSMDVKYWLTQSMVAPQLAGLLNSSSAVTRKSPSVSQ